MVNSRHRVNAAPSPTSRRTHTSAGFDPTVPTNVDYGRTIAPGEPTPVTDVGPGSITDGAIVPGGLDGSTLIYPGTLDITPFASSIRPIALVTTLPGLPDILYPPGSFAYKTDDVPPRLYKNEADAWVAAIGPNDIQANSITAGQIAAGAISTSELDAGAVTADKLQVGGMSGRNLLVNGGFRDGLTGWSSSDGGAPGFSANMWPRDASDWTFADGDTSTGKGSTAYMSGSNVATATYPRMYQIVPVIAGEWYSLTGMLGVHRLSAAHIYLYFYDGSMTGLGPSYDIYVPAANLSLGGGPNIDGWNSLSHSFQAPSGARYMGFSALGVTPNTSGTDWYLFMDQMWLGRGRFPQKYTPQEPQGVINASGEVVIDTTGITIYNGKLTVMDAFGSSQMAAGGLTGGAAELTSLGLQNGTMRATGSIPAGRTSAFPYWTVAFPSGSGNLTVGAWSEGSAGSIISGVRVYKTAAAGSSGVATFLSDLLPIQAGATYTVYLHTSGVCTAGWIYLHADLQFYHPDGVTLQSTQEVSSWTYTSTASNTFTEGTPFDCPTNSKYVKVKLTTEFISTSNAGDYAVYQGVSLVRVPRNVNDLVVTKDYGQTTSMITFPAQSNDPGYIKHIESSNVARMEFSVSDDNASSDYFTFGSTPGGTYTEAVRIAGDGSLTANGQITGPKSPLPWAMEAKTCSVALSSATNGNTSVTWTSSRFSQAPLVFVTIADAPGGSAKFVARAISSTTSGCSVYVYTGDATTQTATVTVNVLAIQMLSGSAAG